MSLNCQIQFQRKSVASTEAAAAAVFLHFIHYLCLVIISNIFGGRVLPTGVTVPRNSYVAAKKRAVAVGMHYSLAEVLESSEKGIISEQKKPQLCGAACLYYFSS